MLRVTLAMAAFLLGSCDNLNWGGADIAIVPPPPKASGVPVSGEDLQEAIPEAPVLFYVVPNQAGGGTMIPIGEILGDSMKPLRANKDVELYATRFIAAHMRRGAEFALYRNGARMGTFVVQGASPPSANACPALPTAQGALELSSGAEHISEFLAIAKPHAPEIRRQLDFATEPTRGMQIIAPILAERMIRARRAELPSNWGRAMVQLRPFPIVNLRDPAFATTFLVGDNLGMGGDNVGYSLFFIGVPGAQFGYDTMFVKFNSYPTEGKAAPRVVDMLDWNRDGQVDLLLQMYGISDTWFEAVGRDQSGEWRRTFRDRCDQPPARSTIPVPDTTRGAAPPAATTTR